ncbi:sigma-70 family RNA polymerase sigma factor [Rhabdobacter roseus]|uniref:RNA polymerase sigma factor (Sigma-70 family) n=1 Tax=Rhabdobacter roseus TaxID=1655419 RepID=A0A840TKY8_9BACT|nr:sigma-70 family RNA polymerase sigma factor [Rhabdobacter roseus]MBB5283605.1 RNA polymerase sigma factor (sigma-70 family) [Rhabdobacter roseus]
MDESYLWNLFREGDGSAFDTLIARHYRVLYHYGSKFSDDEDFVKDCIQDLCVDLWRNRSTLSATEHVKPYLLKALRRKIISTRQKPMYRLTERLPFDAYELEIENSALDKGIDEETTQAQLQRLNQLIESLSPRQREVVYLRYFQNLDFEEISTIMNVNTQSVRNLLYQAIKTLRQHLLLPLLPLLLSLCEKETYA